MLSSVFLSIFLCAILARTAPLAGSSSDPFATFTESSSQTPSTSTAISSDNIASPPSHTAEAVFSFPDQADQPSDQERTKPSNLVMAYYPDWTSFPPEKINFTKFDWIDFAFAIPTDRFTLSWDDPSGAPALLQRLVALAHASGKTKVKLSIGGWTGSQHFSPAVATDQNRRTFVANIVKAVQQYKLDGVDIDWEYPGHDGNAGNNVDPQDTARFLSFLQLLRSSLPPNVVITAATQTFPFVDSSSQPMKDVSEFAKVLDWILLMNYDVWGASSPPGPNAPLYNGCHNSAQPDANAAAAVESWTRAGFPANQLVLGIPSYAYVSTSDATGLRARAQSTSASVVVRPEDGGQIQFRELVNQGALVRDGKGGFIGSGGFKRYWDKCSATPFLRSETAKQVIPYDDPVSLTMKAKFSKEVGLLGVNMFDVHGDTDAWELINAVRVATKGYA